jgi:excisionase family DNA binding protein
MSHMASLSASATSTDALDSSSERHFQHRLALSPAEAASVLGLSRSSIYSMMRAGTLRSVKAGARTLVPVAEIDRFLGDVREDSDRRSQTRGSRLVFDVERDLNPLIERSWPETIR